MMPQPIGLSEPAVLLSSSYTSRHRPQNLQQLLTMNWKTSMNLGFLPPFFMTEPVRCWLENFTLTQGSMVKTVLVQCSIIASTTFTYSTPNTVSRFLLSFTASTPEPAQPISYYFIYVIIGRNKTPQNYYS